MRINHAWKFLSKDKKSEQQQVECGGLNICVYLILCVITTQKRRTVAYVRNTFIHISSRICVRACTCSKTGVKSRERRETIKARDQERERICGWCVHSKYFHPFQLRLHTCRGNKKRRGNRKDKGEEKRKKQSQGLIFLHLKKHYKVKDCISLTQDIQKN